MHYHIKHVILLAFAFNHLNTWVLNTHSQPVLNTFFLLN